ncbi:hypothetical protein AB0F44_06595 [Nocardioides sp. NPDC023903]|uniref:hypothetical protein n=1 Tax=Nocardioides sp. NPDC023903 TaxID=3157195 RepID=UPI0033C85308
MSTPRPRSPRKLSRPKVPVILVSGVAESAMLSATISLQFGLPDAVMVRHIIDPERQLLTRVVSDLTGVIEHEEINLAHACVACAIREDIVPTLERLAAQGRWGSIVACLPVAAEAIQVCRVLAWAPRMAPHISIAAVVAALEGATVAEDLLGPDLLDERGWPPPRTTAAASPRSPARSSSTPTSSASPRSLIPRRSRWSPRSPGRVRPW